MVAGGKHQTHDLGLPASCPHTPHAYEALNIRPGLHIYGCCLGQRPDIRIDLRIVAGTVHSRYRWGGMLCLARRGRYPLPRCGKGCASAAR